MDNKLSELSKPVAWVKADRKIAENWSCTDPEAVISTEGWHSDYNPTYSQEYVSALIHRAERLDSMLTESVQALKAAEQRIAELERANTSQDDHINQQQDRIESLEKTNTGLGQRLGAAEKRLATPVRLPDIRQSSSGDRYQGSDGAHNYRLDVISMLLGAGLTVAVEGVE